MTAILLPSTPLPQSANPKPIDYGSWQEPTMGGAATRLDRLGNRFAMAVTMPRMKPEPNGRIWVARLVDGIGSAVRMAFPQPGFTVGNPGSVQVDGGGQFGKSIKLKGLTSGYTIREGQFFNIVDPLGRYHLLHAKSDVTAGSDGKATVALTQLLRTIPADSSGVNMVPVIEGRLSGNQDGWTLERIGTRGVQFTITENA